MKNIRINQQMGKSAAPHKASHKASHKDRRSERGYALVGLMGVMLFALILTTAAAPSIKLENQREREEEMLWRGQQVADALRKYTLARNGQYPTELKELVEGIQVGIKKVRLLRPSALCDPMTPCDPDTTNWRLVHPGDALPRELLDAIVNTQQKGNAGLIQPPANLVAFAQLGATRLPGQEADTKLDGNVSPVTAQGTGSSTNQLDNKAPIIGVVSRKSDRMFRNYFGIEYYDHTLFFPGVPVMAGGFASPMSIAIAAAPPTNNPAVNCAKGQVEINGKCYGMFPGQQCRNPNGPGSIPCPK